MRKQSLIKQWMVAILFLLTLQGCHTVTVVPKTIKQEVTGPPDFKKSYGFYLWGLIGVKEVNLAKICKGKSLAQAQTQQTFLDGFLTLLTAGIYYKKTAKVWCRG